MEDFCGQENNNKKYDVKSSASMREHHQFTIELLCVYISFAGILKWIFTKQTSGMKPNRGIKQHVIGQEEYPYRL